MFKTPPPADASRTAKGEATRRHLMDQALRTFLARGFERTTLRELSRATGMSLGSFYYYFPTKESIILAFYEENFAHFRDEARRCIAAETKFERLLAGVIETRVRTMGPQREVFLQLASAATDPKSTLSPFSAETSEIREATVGLFHELLQRSDLKAPKTIAPYLPHLLWFAMMGVIFFWTFDRSPGQARTLKLVPMLARHTSRLLAAMNLPVVGKHILPFQEILSLFPDLKPFEPKNANIGDKP